MPYKDRERQREYNKAYLKKYYRANRQRHYDANSKTRQRIQERLRQLKAHPCVDCGVQYPYYVMHFDHLHDKAYNVSRMPARGSMTKLMAEIAKCELVCANCHAVRTHERLEAAAGIEPSIERLKI